MEEITNLYNIRPIQEFGDGIKKICYPLPENWAELTKDVTVSFNVAWKIFWDYLAIILGYAVIWSFIIWFIFLSIYHVLVYIKNKISSKRV